MLNQLILFISFFYKRITGAMGKGLAVLTFDEEYQKKRRQNLNAKPKSFQEGMARSGKGLVMVNSINFCTNFPKFNTISLHLIGICRWRNRLCNKTHFWGQRRRCRRLFQRTWQRNYRLSNETYCRYCGLCPWYL